jgi:hypothetical protein
MKQLRKIFTFRSLRFAVLSMSLVAILLGGFLATFDVTASPDQVLTLGVPGVRGGVVTTSEPAAAQVGADILRKGGNAFDAAAAVQFALNVVEPQSSGVGGGGFMMIHLAKEKSTFVIDCRVLLPRRRLTCLPANHLSPFAPPAATRLDFRAPCCV